MSTKAQIRISHGDIREYSHRASFTFDVIIFYKFIKPLRQQISALHWWLFLGVSRSHPVLLSFLRGPEMRRERQLCREKCKMVRAFFCTDCTPVHPSIAYERAIADGTPSSAIFVEINLDNRNRNRSFAICGPGGAFKAQWSHCSCSSSITMRSHLLKTHQNQMCKNVMAPSYSPATVNILQCVPHHTHLRILIM